MTREQHRALSSRPWSRALVGALLAAVCLPLAACAGSGRSAGSPSNAASADSALNIGLPQSIATMPLVDSAGHRASLAAFKGKVVVISDVMTLCQETCPLDTADLVQAARAVEKAGLGDEVEFLSITIDPQRDTTTQLAAYRSLFAPAPADWATLTGKPSDLAALWKGLGVWSQKVAEGKPPAKNWLTGATLTYDLDHSDDVFFLDQDGNERSLLQGAAHVASGTQLPQALHTFMDDDGHDNLAHPSSDAWTTQQVLHTLSTLLHHPVTQ